jgi:hypothetical protein
LQASSLRQAASLVAELRTTGADVVRVHPSRPLPPGPREWTVALTTPPLPLTVAVIQSWEREMLAVERRWPGCRFLGWMTCDSQRALIGSSVERVPGRDAPSEPQRSSQRELVTASLLRQPAAGRRGIVHGRGAPR